MIIKSLFRRYERWNPVHPTYGAFWGIRIGIGCGIGWGPGCGAGFNVGITSLGIGIGFPANYLLTIPHSAFMFTRRGALDGFLPRNRSIVEDVWSANRSYVSNAKQNPRASFSGFNIHSFTENIRDLPDVNTMLVSHAKHI